MQSRLLVAIGTTALLAGGVFMLRTAAPSESVQAVSSAQAPTNERRSGAVSVVSEVVTARTVQSPRVAETAARSVSRSRPTRPQKRSLFARVFFGNGDSRPQPFPRPASGVSGKP